MQPSSLRHPDPAVGDHGGQEGEEQPHRRPGVEPAFLVAVEVARDDRILRRVEKEEEHGEPDPGQESQAEQDGHRQRHDACLAVTGEARRTKSIYQAEGQRRHGRRDDEQERALGESRHDGEEDADGRTDQDARRSPAPRAQAQTEADGHRETATRRDQDLAVHAGRRVGEGHDDDGDGDRHLHEPPDHGGCRPQAGGARVRLVHGHCGSLLGDSLVGVGRPRRYRGMLRNHRSYRGRLLSEDRHYHLRGILECAVFRDCFVFAQRLVVPEYPLDTFLVPSSRESWWHSSSAVPIVSRSPVPCRRSPKTPP